MAPPDMPSAPEIPPGPLATGEPAFLKSGRRHLRQYESCVNCGECRPPTFRLNAGRVLCASCSEVSTQHDVCTLCERAGPVEFHHVAGRLSPGPLVPLCLNCHACETTMRAGQRSIWQDEDEAGLHLLQGALNCFAVLVDYPPAQEALSRGIAPIVGTILAVLILLHLFAPDMASAFRLGDGSLSWINEELGTSLEDWQRVRWPAGITYRALRQWCLVLLGDREGA